ncbi:hypothetical protein [Dyadobacter sp. OTU695]|uniref:hypothetical protein n=1 Tax=Dyadobacter sp. OTU695 TaxID=3043860 RepID=UPI00313E11EF
MKNFSIFKNALVSLIFYLACSNSTTAQDYAVRPISDFFQSYRDKHKIIMDYVESQQIPLPQRLVLYDTEMTKLKNEFRKDRLAEYKSKKVELTREHSCTSRSNGGVKKCGWKSVSAPNSNMYTRKDLIYVKGTNKGTDVSADGSSASLFMSVAGSGRNAGTLFATFIYKPDSIMTLLDKETVELFTHVNTLASR